MALLPVDEAIARIVAGVEPLPSESVPLGEAGGRTLAEPLIAARTQPPFPASAMDGYAVRSADLSGVPATLRLLGEAAAGSRFRGTVGPGETVRIFTGAPVPEGADAILIQENADTPDAATVIARATVAAGRHIRRAGFDFKAGERLLEPGRVFGPREIAVAAAMGFGVVPVRRRPRVAILSTGDELVPPGTVPGPDQIVASNGPAIAAFVSANGGEPIDLGIIPDDREAIVASIGAGLDAGADILVTIGGVSVGDRDLVGVSLAARGLETGFWRIAMRPGKPLMFGYLPRPSGAPVRVLGLPGNPVSSVVCSILFLAPLLAACLGHPPVDATEPAILATDLPANDERQDYLRAAIAKTSGLPMVSPLPVQDSSGLAVLSAADCLLIRAPHAPAAHAGDACRIIRLVS